jgi:hypothetical protein
MHAGSQPFLYLVGVVPSSLPVDSCADRDSMFESKLVVRKETRKECWALWRRGLRCYAVRLLRRVEARVTLGAAQLPGAVEHRHSARSHAPSVTARYLFHSSPPLILMKWLCSFQRRNTATNDIYFDVDGLVSNLEYVKWIEVKWIECRLLTLFGIWFLGLKLYLHENSECLYFCYYAKMNWTHGMHVLLLQLPNNLTGELNPLYLHGNSGMFFKFYRWSCVPSTARPVSVAG